VLLRWRLQLLFAASPILFYGVSLRASAAGDLIIKSGPQRVSLIELYTSEGCSSCPPAEQWLSGLRKDARLWRTIVPVAFHVDYWDRLGWKDPYSSHEATERQNRYAKLLALPMVYTPQIVVDGKWEAVGSDRAEVERALDLARRDPAEVPVTLALDHGQAQVTLGPGSDRVAASVLLIGFDRRHVTAVKRGENSGRTLAHVDVVRGVEEIARLSPGEIAVPIPWHSDLIAAVVQAADGRILGVAVRDAEPL